MNKITQQSGLSQANANNQTPSGVASTTKDQSSLGPISQTARGVPQEYEGLNDKDVGVRANALLSAFSSISGLKRIGLWLLNNNPVSKLAIQLFPQGKHEAAQTKKVVSEMITRPLERLPGVAAVNLLQDKGELQKSSRSIMDFPGRMFTRIGNFARGLFGKAS